ncbi:hypothetical protein Leryth_019413 [Lithospermum erythrorhizon]|nr:hypothetical protein Leryth_019413 [Lithospermum erythrorhizon]
MKYPPTLTKISKIIELGLFFNLICTLTIINNISEKMAVSVSLMQTFTVPNPKQLGPWLLSNNQTLSSCRRKLIAVRCAREAKEREGESGNYYELLGVSGSSSAQQIKDAYRKLQKIHHPDIAGQEIHALSNCIHWVELKVEVLEYLMQPRPKEGYGIFGHGWERPKNVFMAAKSFNNQTKNSKSNAHRHQMEETPAQAQARADATPLVELTKETVEKYFSGDWRKVAEGSLEILKGEAIPLEYNLAGLNAINDNGNDVDQKVASKSEIIDAASKKKIGTITTALGSRGMGILRIEEAFKNTSSLTIQGQEDIKGWVRLLNGGQPNGF